MLIEKKKFYTVSLMLLLLVIEIIAANGILYGYLSLTVDNSIQLVSAICVFLFVLSILTWKLLTNEIICPYLFFYICLFLFCCGQSLTWAFGLTAGTRDLMTRVDYGLNHDYILISLIYSMLCLTMFHVGAILYTKGGNPDKALWNSQEVTKTFKNLGKLLLVFTIPAFIATSVQVVLSVISGGYLAYYDLIYERFAILKILDYVADYYQPCLLLLLVGYRDGKSRTKAIIVSLFILDIIAQLYIGGRNRAVLAIISIILVYHYFIKPVNVKRSFLIIIGGYFGLAFLNAIRYSRIESGRGIFSFLEYVDLAPLNVLCEIIGELGWSLSSTTWTMMYAENSIGFQYGMTYLMAPLGIIPNLGFWAVHPAKAYNPSEWLQSFTMANYGLGYTMVAESFINFGWFGCIFMLFAGGLIVNFLDRVRRIDVENNLFVTTFQIMFIMTLTKLLVRSTFASTVREIGYVLIPLYFLITYKLYKQVRIRKKHELLHGSK